METEDKQLDLKEAETGSDPDTDKDYASFEAGNRKRRLIIVSAAIVVGVVSIAALIATMGSIGKMSAQVEDAFYDPQDQSGGGASAELKAKKEPSAERAEEVAPAPATEGEPGPESESSGAAEMSRPESEVAPETMEVQSPDAGMEPNPANPH